jgi:F-type H+-transporting ATPase subunit b
MIDLDFTLMLIVSGVFLTLMWVLNIMLFKPLLQHLDGRKKTIEDGLNNVNQNSQEIKDLELKAEEILHLAKQKANEVRETALASAKVIASEKLNAKRVDIEQEMASFYTNLEEEQKTLKNSLLGQAPLFKESLRAKFVLTNNQ